MDSKVRSSLFIFLAESNPDCFIQYFIDSKTKCQSHSYGKDSPDQLCDKADFAKATQCFLTKDSTGNASP